MGKNPDNLAGHFEAENTGGWLDGFLADEGVLDRRALWRLGSWGVASVGCVIVALLANQSSISVRRDQIAAADLARQSQLIQSVARESQSEARQLASAIDTLGSDRDRLYSRVTALEQGLDSVTGTIARQKAVTSVTAEPSPASPNPAPARSRRWRPWRPRESQNPPPKPPPGKPPPGMPPRPPGMPRRRSKVRQRSRRWWRQIPPPNRPLQMRPPRPARRHRPRRRKRRRAPITRRTANPPNQLRAAVRKSPGRTPWPRFRLGTRTYRRRRDRRCSGPNSESTSAARIPSPACARCGEAWSNRTPRWRACGR